MLTLAALRKIMPRLSEERAAFWLPYLNAAMAEFGITTPARMAMWLANVAHETAELSKLVESLNYSAARMIAVWPTRFGHRRGATEAQKAEGRRRAASLAHKPTELALYVYGSRSDLGNRPGTFDGADFIGRGAPHLTGRAAYEKAGKALGLPLLNEPQLLEHPENAARVAGWFWQSKAGMNAAADAGDSELVRRKWNGGLNGLAEVLAYEKRARVALAA